MELFEFVITFRQACSAAALSYKTRGGGIYFSWSNISFAGDALLPGGGRYSFYGNNNIRCQNRGRYGGVLTKDAVGINHEPNADCL
ncbi:MAG: hypothetical protein K2G30_03085 [Muribaculaceae bacterium]|nr:hypothetical protein [Muribaculaceae bacterium]